MEGSADIGKGGGYQGVLGQNNDIKAGFKAGQIKSSSLVKAAAEEIAVNGGFGNLFT